MPIDLLHFVRKWQAATLTERSAAQQHFRDLCEALDVPHPTEADEIGASYTYEKRVTKTGTGEGGFADVWKRGFFAWEYKSKGGDLKKAYKQLNEYHESLENPPLLIVCDFTRFEVHTKFENVPSRTFAFTLDELLVDSDTATSALPPLTVLRHVFGDFNQLRPHLVAVPVTRAAASDFLRLARQLELERAAAPIAASKDAGGQHSKEKIARFLMQLVFCLFADSIDLLPNHSFRRLITNDRFSPLGFNRKLPVLFAAMSERSGFFGPETIPYFNGGLFRPDDNPILELNVADLGILHAAAQHDWSHIEPVIFGTLFERSLDASKRSMIGAHFTSPDDILLLIEPVVIAPLKRRWHEVQQQVLAALATESTPEANPSSSRPDPTNQACDSERSEEPPHSTRSATNAQVPPQLGAPSSPTALPSVRVGFPHANAPATRRPQQSAIKLDRPALNLLQDWAAELTRVRILDPACGSGNFLYIALRRLLDLWHEARVFGVAHGLTLALDPIPNPSQLFGIEIDFYAHEIASIVVWIGFLQWKHDHGVKEEKEPLLEVLSNIQLGDAILRYNAEGKPYEPTWPEAEYIVGNPPFLGGKFLRRELGDVYVNALFDLYRGRVKAESDLVVYWFEKARAQLQEQKVERAGLLATQGIRGGANRAVLERIQQTGTIFWAWSDRPWLLAGATVHVSMIAFEGTQPAKAAAEETAEGMILGIGHQALKARPIPAQGEALGSSQNIVQRAESPIYSQASNHTHPGKHPYSDIHPIILNGEPVSFINPDLTTGSNTASAFNLKENANLCFMGTTKVGPFNIDAETARKMLGAPLNPNGRPNSDVVRPWVNALDITTRPRNMFIIDFGTDMKEREAALYQLPFEYIRHHVRPLRSENARAGYASRWWIHGEARGDLRRALSSCSRYVLTSRVSKHRLFIWLPTETLPDSATFAFARDDNYFFGVLHCSIHERWALIMGTQLESRPRYTPDSTFDTFPFPWPPGTEPTEAEDPRIKAIADAARELVRLRDAWLNPPNTPDADLKKRTLTNLYNQRPTWLDNAHRALDTAVFAAYGWAPDLTTQQILANLLALNHKRAAAQPEKAPRKAAPAAKRKRRAAKASESTPAN